MGAALPGTTSMEGKYHIMTDKTDPTPTIRDDMIEKAARALAADAYATPDAWDVWVTGEGSRNRYRRHARVALQAAGVDPSEPEPEPLPDQQVRVDPDGWAWQKLTTYPDMPIGGSWRTSGPPAYPLTDDRVRDWPVMEVIDPACRPEPKATIDAKSLARHLWDAGQLGYDNDDETWPEVTAHQIRKWADEHGHRPPVPENHVTIDMSMHSTQLLKLWANGTLGYPHADAARAELARRGEQVDD